MSEEDFRSVGLVNWAKHQAQQVEDIAEKSDLVARLRAENERLRDVLSQTYALASHWETTAEEVADFVSAALKETSDE